MKYLPLFILSLLLWVCPAHDIPVANQSKNYQIAFYNVENLFDTINEPGKRDGEYTPVGSKEWDTKKYLEKLDRIAQVIASIDSTETLAAIGLAEVENLRVLEDLVKQKRIAHLRLKIIHQESPDFRGIDVALLYNPKLINPVSFKFLNVDLNDSGKTTRDILVAEMVDFTNDTMTIFVNHWPSRWGGQDKTEPKRIAAAQTLRKELSKEEIQTQNILILGDLNDYPDNKSVWEVLDADSSAANDGTLYNATYAIHADSTQGTHAYRGHWGVLDHGILSPVLYGFIDSVYVHKKRFMLYKNSAGDWFPSRTHSGKRYFGGYSDHLPVVVNFK